MVGTSATSSVAKVAVAPAKAKTRKSSDVSRHISRWPTEEDGNEQPTDNGGEREAGGGATRQAPCAWPARAAEPCRQPAAGCHRTDQEPNLEIRQ